MLEVPKNMKRIAGKSLPVEVGLTWRSGRVCTALTCPFLPA
jgi:hypothetical protein